MVVGTEQRDGAARLGEPVRVDERGLGEQLEGALEHRRRHACAAVRQVPQRGRGCRRVGIERMDDAGEHRRHDERVRHAFAARELEPAFGSEPWQRDDAPPRVRGAEHRGDAGDVERRHGHQHRLVVIGRRELHGVELVGEELVVLEHGRLGLGGRAAREQEHGGA